MVRKIEARFHLNDDAKDNLHDMKIIDANGRSFTFTNVDKEFAKSHNLLPSNLKFWYPSLYFIQMAAKENPDKTAFSMEFLDEKANITYGYVEHDPAFDFEVIEYVNNHLPHSSYSINIETGGREYVQEYLYP